MDKESIEHIYANKVECSFYLGISVNDSVPACCRGGVRFESGPHCVILETIKMVPMSAISGTSQ